MITHRKTFYSVRSVSRNICFCFSLETLPTTVDDLVSIFAVCRRCHSNGRTCLTSTRSSTQHQREFQRFPLGLTVNSDALIRWMNAGPEVARLKAQSEFASLKRFTAPCSKSSVSVWGLGHMFRNASCNFFTIILGVGVERECLGAGVDHNSRRGQKTYKQFIK